MNGQEEAIVAEVLDAEHLRHAVAGLQLDQPAIGTDAVFRVHQVVAGRELRDALDRVCALPVGLAVTFLARPEDLLFRDDDQSFGFEREAFAERCDPHFDSPGARPAPDRPRVRCGEGFEVVLVQQIAQSFGARERRAGDDHAPALGNPESQAIDQRVEGAFVCTRCGELASQILVTDRAHRDARGLGLVRGDVEPLERDGHPLVERAKDLIRRKQQCAVMRNRARGVERRLIVANRFLAVLREPLAAWIGLVQHDQGVVRQEIEDGLELRLQQGSQCLHARGMMTAQQCIDEFRHRSSVGPLLLGECADVVGAIDHHAAVAQELARRRQRDAHQLLLGSLARGVEVADRLDFVAQ